MLDGPRMSSIQRLFCCFLVCASLSACASSSAARSEVGGALLVSLQNLRTGECFELASESHTDRVTYYSDASHVAIYIGDGMMVHASTYGTPVRVAPVDNAPIHNVRRY